MTTAQTRDALIELLPVTAETVREVRNLALQIEGYKQQDPETYAECPRCHSHHSIHGNYDNLCDRCQSVLVEHFPNHPSVPHIKRAMARWSNPGGTDV